MKQPLPMQLPIDLSVGIGAPAAFVSDATVYDASGATGSVSGGVVVNGEYQYD